MIDPWSPPYSWESNRYDKIETYWKSQYKMMEKKRQEEIRKQKIDTYWAEHQDEKNQLESELESIKRDVSELNTSIRQYEDRVNSLRRERESLSVPAQKQLIELRQSISSVTAQRDKCGLFQGKMKKELQSQIDELNQEEANIKELVEKQLENAKEEINNKIRMEETEMQPYKDRVSVLNKREVEIKSKLSCPC